MLCTTTKLEACDLQSFADAAAPDLERDEHLLVVTGCPQGQKPIREVFESQLERRSEMRARVDRIGAEPRGGQIDVAFVVQVAAVRADQWDAISDGWRHGLLGHAAEPPCGEQARLVESDMTREAPGRPFCSTT